MKFKYYVWLLALSYEQPIREWRPFQNKDTLDENKKTLDEIINEFNDTCYEFVCKSFQGDLYYVETLGRGIRIFPHDLSEITELKKHGAEYFNDIRFILIDVDLINEKKIKPEAIDLIRDRLSKYTQPYYVLKVGKALDKFSYEEYFSPLKVILPNAWPAIIQDKKEFMKALQYYCDFSCSAASDMKKVTEKPIGEG